MEEDIVELLHGLVEGRNDFFVRTMQLTPHSERANLLSRFLLNEVSYLETANRIINRFPSANNDTTQTAVLRFNIPANFNDPVPVVATQAQIYSAIEDVENTTTNCAICQDSIGERNSVPSWKTGVKIKQCGHVYHLECILAWFRENVRCPVCRHDIREAGETLDEEEDDSQSSGSGN